MPKGRALGMEELDAELAKRLRSCRSPKQTLVAAKAIAVVHRLVLAGGGAALPECGAELPGVCSAPEGDPMLRAQADAVADAADYVRQLREWPEAAALRTHGGGVTCTLAIVLLGIGLLRIISEVLIPSLGLLGGLATVCLIGSVVIHGASWAFAATSSFIASIIFSVDSLILQCTTSSVSVCWRS